MANQIIKLKNMTSRVLSFAGKDLLVGEVLDVSPSLQTFYKESTELFDIIGCGDIVVNDGTKDLSATDGWKWLLGNGGFPISEIGNKVWVHSSTKPVIDGKMFYVQWVGSGDNEDLMLLGQGPIAAIQNIPGTPRAHVDLKFANEFGDTFVHEGYAMWENAKLGDYVNALIVAEGTHVQQFQDLDLIVDIDGYLKYSPSGPGTGTHGFAAPPYLLPRTFSHDGDWDYDETNGLRPNFAGTGEYKMSINECIIHRFINRMPLLGTNGHPVRLASEDTFKLPHGYFLRLECVNASNSEWSAAFFITVYRERTFVP